MPRLKTIKGYVGVVKMYQLSGVCPQHIVRMVDAQVIGAYDIQRMDGKHSYYVRVADMDIIKRRAHEFTRSSRR